MDSRPGLRGAFMLGEGQESCPLQLQVTMLPVTKNKIVLAVTSANDRLLLCI